MSAPTVQQAELLELRRIAPGFRRRQAVADIARRCKTGTRRGGAQDAPGGAAWFFILSPGCFF
jgi:hypothetical protein